MSSTEIRSSFDSFVVDSGRGLAAAINAGVASLPASVTLVNWLGDDDRLCQDGVTRLTAAFVSDEIVLAYGRCTYIDADGQELFTVRSSRWAEPLMRCGPQLISQPAMLFRREAFRSVGGLDEKLKMAFDLDLLIRLRRFGRFASVPHVTASYRWHQDALTVGSRKQSVHEASTVRVRHLPRLLKRLSILWEPIVRFAVLRAGNALSRRFVSRV